MARDQGQGHKKISRPRTDPLEAKDQERRRKCSPKKRFSKKFFKQSQKKGLLKIFSDDKVLQIFFSGNFHLRKTKKVFVKFSARFLPLSNKISTVQKIVLSSSQGQGNFRGLEASRPRLRPRTSKCVLEVSISVTYVWYILLTFFFG